MDHTISRDLYERVGFRLTPNRFGRSKLLYGPKSFTMIHCDLINWCTSS